VGKDVYKIGVCISCGLRTALKNDRCKECNEKLPSFRDLFKAFGLGDLYDNKKDNSA
jgi:hypothetical protein